MVRRSWMLLGVVLSASASACIEPHLVSCGIEQCPVGTICVDPTSAAPLCSTPEALAACSNVADGAACTNAGIGYCDRGVCVPSGCGNGVIDPGEACDDGNIVGGDGCSSDCKKVEICGDGVVDVGEGCDDGNTNPADGCDACVTTAWTATVLIGGATTSTGVGLTAPHGVAVDRHGAVFIADSNSNRIRRVDPNGVITTVAGDGTSGFGGDGGPATSAQLSNPFGVAVDGLGNLFIADTANLRIRRVDPSGVITTVAGDGTPGFGGDGGGATSAHLGYVLGVAVDGLDDVFIADTDNNRIRRVDPNGIITTFAGNSSNGSGGDGGPATSAQLGNPYGVAVDELGNVFIADTGNFRIRRVDPNGVITTFAGNGASGFGGDGGPATSAQLAATFGVAVDGLGDVLIDDGDNQRIRRVDPNGVITTIAGDGTSGFGGDTGPATNAQLATPHGVAADGLGSVFVADTSNNRVRQVSTNGVITTVAGNGASGFGGDGGAATSVQLFNPVAVAGDGLGNVFIVEKDHDRIRRVDPSGVITTVAGDGTSGFGGDGGAATSAQLAAPSGVAADAHGAIFIADQDNNRIRQIDTNGIITTIAGDGTYQFGGDGGAATSAQLRRPGGIAVDGHGNVFIADTENGRIRRIDATGVITTVAGNGGYGLSGDGGPATSASLAYPSGVAVDGLGNLFIADTFDNCIRRVDPNGVITTVAGNGNYGIGGDGGAATSAQLDSPGGVAVDGLGNVFIAGSQNNRIRRVNQAGTITTFAGDGTSDFGGDGGAATSAQLYTPVGVAVDGLGDVLIADVDTHHIRKVDSSGTITTIAGAIDAEGMGPFAQAHLTDPRALVVAAPFTLVAGGTSGTVQAALGGTSLLEVAVGRYAQAAPTGALARFRDDTFGMVSGVAYDPAAAMLYLTESSANRIQVVHVVDPNNRDTWTIAPLANTAGTRGFADGAAATARFRNPTGLYFDAPMHLLYVADTGNHVIRAIDLSGGTANATVHTVIGTPATVGYFGDGGAARSALLYAPQAITKCDNGDLFVADTGNHRVRRVVASTGVISTVLGVGVAASSGDGVPASTFPVNAPLALGCDVTGNLYVTSTTTVRLVTADASGVVDGSGRVETIYGGAPTLPTSVTTCMTGLAITDSTTLQVTDSCTGQLVALHRKPR